MKTFYTYFSAIFFLLILSDLNAQIRLPEIISSDMIVQRNAVVKIWGWSQKKETITLEGSWLSEVITTKADQSGKWMMTVPTTNSRASQSIKISDKSSEVVLENILFGDVWLSSGQSNMEMSLSGRKGEPTFHGLEGIAKSNNPNLRLFTINKSSSTTPIDTLGQVKRWESSNPDAVANFSAVGYFFGSQLQKALDVPIGLIHCSWGGSSIQAWMSEEVLNAIQPFHLDSFPMNTERELRKTPTLLYNAMIYPITNYGIKGVIWYQGESNRLEPEIYQELLPAMVKDWRNRWNQNFSFQYVQLAPYYYRNPDAYNTAENSAFIRESQLKALELIPNSGMVVTLDIGNYHTIHPPNKKEIGDRLFYLTMNNTYGYESVDHSGPIYSHHDIESDSLIIHFDHAENGLFSSEGLKNFEISGEDRVFYPAEATILNRTEVLVKSDQVPLPVAARYSWSNWVKGSLFDTNLLPASSFRTDAWDDATRADNPKEK